MLVQVNDVQRVYSNFMTNIVAVIQTKGGTGKTTTTMMLAFALSSLGKSVHVIDSDKQSSAKRWASKVGDKLGFTVERAISPQALQGVLNDPRLEQFDFVLIDTPQGSNATATIAAEAADLMLLPTGISPLDMERTQDTLTAFEGFDLPIAVVLVNVDRREKLLDEVQAELATNARAALADTIIPTRSSTRKVGGTAPNIRTKKFQEWMDLTHELLQAF